MGRPVTGSQLVLKFLILAQKGSFANIIANSNKEIERNTLNLDLIFFLIMLIIY
jgi:hypothetical protein